MSGAERGFAVGRARMALLAQVATAIHREGELDGLLQCAADAIHEQLGYDNVDIPLLDPAEPGVLVIRIRGGRYKAAIRREDRLAIGQGIIGTAARERRTQRVNDVARDPRYVCPPGVPPAVAELAVPIQLQGTLYGVLNVESGMPFDDEDQVALELIADFLALAIGNLERLEGQRRDAVQAERARLARELHDSVTQMLASISLLAQSLQGLLRRDPEQAARRLARLQQLTQSAFAEMRMLLRELSPVPGKVAAAPAGRVPGGSLPDAVAELLAALPADGLRHRSAAVDWQDQRPDHETALYRVCQEAVSNTVRHARAQELRIDLIVASQQVMLSVTDDGVGIGTEFRPGLGLVGMRERLEALGGSLRIVANDPRGTRIEARLPRADRASARPSLSATG